MRALAILLYASLLAAQPANETPLDAATIMAKVAATMEKAAEGRKQYVYHQKIRSSLVRTNGQIARREAREYSVIPTEKGTEKKLVSFKGEYRKGKQTLSYSKPGFNTKGYDIDGELISDLTDDLVDDKDSRDGIPHSLFPLASKDLAYYKFTMKGRTDQDGRRAYQILFEPAKGEMCVNIGGKDDCLSRPWKGEAWIDAEEFQPMRIVTELAIQIPWGVRVFLGTNLRQTGFSVTYRRVGENIWFPATYGTEFRLNVLWGYRRTVTLALESSDFRKADAVSKIAYDIN